MKSKVFCVKDYTLDTLWQQLRVFFKNVCHFRLFLKHFKMYFLMRNDRRLPTDAGHPSHVRDYTVANGLYLTQFACVHAHVWKQEMSWLDFSAQF